MCTYNTQDYEIGDEISSTGEGRVVTVPAADITWPATAIWDVGDIVVAGENLAGVALTSHDSNDDYVAIDTEGIWCLGVSETVVVGDEVYLDPDTGVLRHTYVLYDIPFGIALTGATYASVPVACAIKVHLYPRLEGGDMS